MKTVIKMLSTLTLIGILSGGLLAFVNGWADPLIKANQKAETEKAIFLVNPEGKSYSKIETKLLEAYKVLDESNKLIGYSIAREGNGFQGKIRIMIGVSENLESINSIEILEQTETPGLGTKVTEDPFTSQFKSLETSPVVEWVKAVPPSKPNEIQAVTGATISSKAVVQIINDGISVARELKKKGDL
jgi:electron transport complex protein RnfG